MRNLLPSTVRVLGSFVLLFLLATAAVPNEDAPENQESKEVLDHYVHALQNQQQNMKGVSMEVDISAELPKLKKSAHMEALRFISRLGKITYEALKSEGDNTVKKEIIARYLAAETEANGKTAPAIVPEHYKFKYKGLSEKESRAVYVFQVTPRHKLPGTFKGELWLDKETYLPVQEAGRLTRNPSVFVKRFDFVRKYVIEDGLAIPKKVQGIVETRLWGKAEVNIKFSKFARSSDARSEVATEEAIVSKTP